MKTEFSNQSIHSSHSGIEQQVKDHAGSQLSGQTGRESKKSLTKHQMRKLQKQQNVAETKEYHDTRANGDKDITASNQIPSDLPNAKSDNGKTSDLQDGQSNASTVSKMKARKIAKSMAK